MMDDSTVHLTWESLQRAYKDLMERGAKPTPLRPDMIVVSPKVFQEIKDRGWLREDGATLDMTKVAEAPFTDPNDSLIIYAIQLQGAGVFESADLT